MLDVIQYRADILGDKRHRANCGDWYDVCRNCGNYGRLNDANNIDSHLMFLVRKGFTCFNQATQNPIGKNNRE